MKKQSFKVVSDVSGLKSVDGEHVIINNVDCFIFKDNINFNSRGYFNVSHCETGYKIHSAKLKKEAIKGADKKLKLKTAKGAIERARLWLKTTGYQLPINKI